MAHYITEADPDNFQPMNANFGLFPPLERPIRGKKEKNERLAARALESIKNFSYNLHISMPLS